jgi:drug/metabolite transporter (DMT)-like permease
LVAAVFYGAYLLLVKHLRREFSGLTIMSWSGLVSCPGFLVGGRLLGENLWPGTVKAWLVLVGLGVVSQLGGQTLIATALGHLPASYSSVGLLLQPVLASFLAWMLFEEKLSLVQLLGGLVVLAGIGLATWRRGPTVSG